MKKILLAAIAILALISIASGGYRFGQYLAQSKSPSAPPPATKSVN